MGRECLEDAQNEERALSTTPIPLESIRCLVQPLNSDTSISKLRSFKRRGLGARWYGMSLLLGLQM